ncbi:MAG: O-antigen ligase family protein [Opitutaceae bacterium]
MQTTLLAANLAWTTLCLGGYLPETMVVSSALTALALATHFLARAFSSARPAPLHWAGWLLIPFVLYAAANAQWVTPVRWLGWMDWLGWAQMIATFWIVLNGMRSAAPRAVLFGTVVAVGLVAVTLACYQRFVHPDWLMLGRVQAAQFLGRSSGPFGIPNSLAGFLLLLLPPCGAMAFRAGAQGTERIFFGWLALVLALGLGLTISRGAWVAFALAVPLWPLLARRWPLQRRVAIAATTLLVVLLGVAALYRTSPKVRDRFTRLVLDEGERTRPIMWRAAWQIFRAQPVFGSGAGSYNILFERHRTERVQGEPQWAHQEYLNTLSDYGLVGFALFFGACGAIAWRCARQRRLEGAAPFNPRRSPSTLLHSDGIKAALDDAIVKQGFAIGLVAFGLQLAVDFHFKIPALAQTFAIWTALAIGRDSTVQSMLLSKSTRLACGLVAILVPVLVLICAIPRYRGEALRADLRRQLDRLATNPTQNGKVSEAVARLRDDFGRALQFDAGNAQTWADRAYAAAIAAHHDTTEESALGREAEANARQALSLSSAAPEFWVRLGVALDMQKRWPEAGEAFTEALRLAPFSGRIWFYQAYHLSLNPVTVYLARSAVATCLRLDPGNIEGESLHRHLSARP